MGRSIRKKRAKRGARKQQEEVRTALGLAPARRVQYVVVRNIAGQTMQVPVDENGDPVAAPDIARDIEKYKGVKTIPGSG